MSDDFAARLDAYIKQAGLPVRRIAHQAGVPHQTLYNWLKGKRPRWHPALTDDLRRLALALGLEGAETDRLLQAAGCLSQRFKSTLHARRGWGRRPEGDAPRSENTHTACFPCVICVICVICVTPSPGLGLRPGLRSSPPRSKSLCHSHLRATLPVSEVLC
ncbi:MAG: helix-turn-helix domain-containing protein [Isosphaerales bacterium]